MGNVDDGGAQSLVQFCDLSSHLYTQLGVQVGKRLVHQEYLGASDDRTAHGDSLSLTTGKSFGLTVKQMAQVKDLGSFFNSLVDLILRNFTKLQAECHIIINSHVRIQSVVLEYHGDISVLGLYIVHELAINFELTGGNVFQTCDHTKSCGFSASGRAYEDDEFLVFDLHVEVLNCLESVRIYFADVL